MIDDSIDNSDFKVWNEEYITNLFKKVIEREIEELKEFLINNRDFEKVSFHKENYLKGQLDAYQTCLNIGFEEIKLEIEEKEKDVS